MRGVIISRWQLHHVGVIGLLWTRGPLTWTLAVLGPVHGRGVNTSSSFDRPQEQRR